LKNLCWQALPERFVQADEIEIRPHATGLNFRDVMYAMGLLSDEAVENGFAGPTLGMEVAGTVVKVGSAVREFKEGDEVLGFAPACFSSRVITQTTAITHKPESWSFEESATIPTTFFTVYYALKHLAQIQPGEKILIHGAAGGVGIAAIQYARYCGAEIFATAGTDEKRDFVRLLGADHVMDSRSLAFSDEIMEITNDEGIDIVLNSLAGEAITRNLSVLKPFGRFLELGKRDFYENSKIGLRPFRNNISYFGIDADQLLIERAELANRLFKEMMALFNDGSLRPMPYRSFPAARIEDAFRYMQQSRQIGKVVVSFDHVDTPDFIEQIEPLHSSDKELVCDAKGSYLVTGGLSGFGLKTASWLVEKGARSLVLVSRSASVSDQSRQIIEELKEKGVQVYTRACDVADKVALTKLISEIQGDISPLKGVVHAAMVLEDGLLRNMTQQQLQHVMTPKIKGSWNLHALTENIDLDFFVMYSSATTYVGNPGQANYVAANSYLESLASYRKSKGLPASYAAWGAIADVGFLARNEETKEALQSRLGGHALSSDQALKMLEKIILSGKVGAAVIDLDWGVIQRVMPAASSAKYAELQRSVKASDSDHFEDIHTLIANMGRSEIQDLVVDLLLDEIEQILRLPREKLDVEQSIFDLGMDSLMGMELVLAIEERFAVKLPVMALTEGANILRIAQRITDQLSSSEVEQQDDVKKAPTGGESKHQENISIAAARHGHTQDVTQVEAEKLSRSLIEDAMNASKE
jgi:NADPH:quinone reductase-like Zn-dependent oxidoreductase/short-subunit dehydrogenase/acyl carrier protein